MKRSIPERKPQGPRQPRQAQLAGITPYTFSLGNIVADGTECQTVLIPSAGTLENATIHIRSINGGPVKARLSQGNDSVEKAGNWNVEKEVEPGLNTIGSYPIPVQRYDRLAVAFTSPGGSTLEDVHITFNHRWK